MPAFVVVVGDVVGGVVGVVVVDGVVVVGGGVVVVDGVVVVGFVVGAGVVEKIIKISRHGRFVPCTNQ